MGYRKVVIGDEVYMMTPKWYKEFRKFLVTLKELEKTDYENIDVSELVDIRDVKIDRKQPKFYRMMMFVNQIKIHIALEFVMLELELSMLKNVKKL